MKQTFMLFFCVELRYRAWEKNKIDGITLTNRSRDICTETCGKLCKIFKENPLARDSEFPQL